MFANLDKYAIELFGERADRMIDGRADGEKVDSLSSLLTQNVSLSSLNTESK